MKLTREQVRRYFEARLQGQRIATGPEVSLKCPFHDDRTPSLSINLEKGVWKCHAGCGEGGLLDFESRHSNCDHNTARANVAELIGDKQLGVFSERPEAVYRYQDAQERTVFEKLRFAGKRFVQRRRNEKGGFDYKLGDCQKPLYRLPEVLVANEIFVCEGEKDADNVSALNLTDREHGRFIAATTNFDGAGKWRDEYGVYFAGKKVVVLADNDEAGHKHAERVAASVHPYAIGVKVVHLPDLPPKGDVSDYLKSHTPQHLVVEVNKAPLWRPPAEQQSRVLVSATEFISATPTEVDLMVQDVIQRGANGFFCAIPKGGKSWAAADLALSLAMGCEWLGLAIPRPVPVALISREDNPALTGWRLRHLLKGKGGDNGLLSRNLYVNSRAQTPELMLDNSEQVAELVAELKQRSVQFAIFDVFNVMHAADENDNTEMRAVLRQLSLIQSEVGCGIGVIHHFNKASDGTMTQRLRGSSAIAGWAEWLIGISMADEETKTRRMDFELKAAQSPEPIYYRIEGDDSAVRLNRTDYTPARPDSRREGSAAERYM